MGTRQVPLCWPHPVCSVHGYSSMSLVSAPSGHAEGTDTPVAGDPLLAKSAQGVPHRPWPALTASAGLLKSGEIWARWCQTWVSAAWRPVRFISAATT
jgi:hypothetical protein